MLQDHWFTHTHLTGLHQTIHHACHLAATHFFYVALSRVKKLCRLHNVHFNAKAIKKSTLVDDEMIRFCENLLQIVAITNEILPFSTHITLAVLNVRSIVGKLATRR